MRYSIGTHRTEGFEHETNDCTVRALKNVTGVPYSDAHTWTAKRGRKDRKGCPLNQWFAAMGSGECIYGYYVRLAFRAEFKRQVQTLQSIAWRYPRGRYVLFTRNHAIALVDGVVHDMAEVGGRHRIIEIWEFQLSSAVDAREEN